MGYIIEITHNIDELSIIDWGLIPVTSPITLISVPETGEWTHINLIIACPCIYSGFIPDFSYPHFVISSASFECEFSFRRVFNCERIITIAQSDL